MKMDREQFTSRYGKIRYLDSISERHPVRPVCQNDINRKLMIKFKYGDITPVEEHEFHEAMKKMIFKAMHKNNVMMDWDDVYQEIWKKIVKSRHTWKEWKGTMVSTWITIVANSVINTLRQNVKKYNSRFCLYDDIQTPNSDGGNDTQQKCDLIAFNGNEEANEDGSLKRMAWREQFDVFRSKLDKAEAFVFDIILSMQDAILDAYDSRLKLPMAELRQKSGYDEATFAMIIYNIKRKYCEAFGIPFVETDPPDPGDGSETEFLF